MESQVEALDKTKWGTLRDPVTMWLLLVALLVVVMVIVGGYTRLSRAGLSIVEWDVVTGILPPIGQEAWEESFELYQQTPEYQLVNTGMTVSAYKQIFYIEWSHRLIGRIAGMLVVIPLLWFMWRRIVTPRESIGYWLVAAGFGIQGAIGWVMVSSGLQDRPAVSEFRLTIHLLAALTLLGIVLWMALDRIEAARARSAYRSSRSIRVLSWAVFATVIVQIAYGGLVAGLKAGHLSNTWPHMFGYLIPGGMLATADSAFLSLFEPLASHWIHRWFAFVVAALAVAMFVVVRRRAKSDHRLEPLTMWLLVVIGTQISLGVTVILLGVPKYFALLHQVVGITVFCISLLIAHAVESRSRSDRDISGPVRASIQ